jgi:glutathione peroxidase
MPIAPLSHARQWGYTARPSARKFAMTSAHAFAFPKLDQPGEIKLTDFAGKVVLVVNVASACGFTSQYRDLEALYEAKAGKGLVVIGVPCNDFGHQEPGEEKAIRDFCDATYHVKFPMAGKVEIAARERRHPLYGWIAEQLGESALPRWNFHKYLIGKDGALVETFPSKATPLGPAMLEAIDRALAA